MTSCVTWSERWPTEDEVRAAFRDGAGLDLLVRFGSRCERFGVVLRDGAVVLFNGNVAATLRQLGRLAPSVARFAGAPLCEPYGAPVGESPDA